MKSPLHVGWLLAASALLWACTVSPTSRLESYLGPIPAGEASQLGQSKFEAGLLVINDTDTRDSAPALLDPAMQFVTARTQQRIDRDLPIKIVKLVRADQLPPGREPSRFTQLAREQGVKYLVVAIFSSAESEVPASHPFGGSAQGGGGLGVQPGYTATNYALVELALLDAEAGRPLATSEGRAWATLDRLAMGGFSNVFPVIRRSLRVEPIFPSEQNAYDMLRGLTGDEALDQAVMHLREAWSRAS